ncbi:MAG: LysM peptidoglycan-binding domain-containing protein, partial [Chloroflexota bacterium]
MSAPTDYVTLPFVNEGSTIQPWHIIAGLIAIVLFIWAGFFRTPAERPAASAIDAPSSPLATISSEASAILDEPTEAIVSTPTEAISQQTAVPSPSPTPSPTPEPVIHRVAEGEILGVIATLYNTSVEDIMAINGIADPTLLQIGQELIIPVTPTPVVEITPDPTEPVETPTPVPTPVTYIVQSGDTLSTIAAEYETTVEAMIVANDLTDASALQIGQTLLIPPDDGIDFEVP